MPREIASGEHGLNPKRSSVGTVQNSIQLPKCPRMYAWEALGVPVSSQAMLKMSFSGNQDDI